MNFEIFRDLGRIVLSVAPHFIVREHAPATFTDLQRNDELTIWCGASENTIYEDAQINYAARAWHDNCHLIGGHGFTLEGEIATWQLQDRQMLERFPGLAYGLQGAMIRRALYADVVGQSLYFAKHGEFPADQRNFVRSLL